MPYYILISGRAQFFIRAQIDTAYRLEARYARNKYKSRSRMAGRAQSVKMFEANFLISQVIYCCSFE